MVMWHISWFINTILTLWNVNDNKFFFVPNFDSNSIISSDVVANKSFSIGKPIRPRFKLFKAGNYFHLETPTQKVVELLTASITFPLFYNKEEKILWNRSRPVLSGQQCLVQHIVNIYFRSCDWGKPHKSFLQLS